MKKFLDTNIILRFLLADDKNQSAAAKTFFNRLIKEKELVEISVLVIAEVIYFLEKILDNRKKIAISILAIINLPAVIIEEKEILEEALSLYQKYRIDFVDCYHAAYCQAKKIRSIVSFDRDFDKISFLKRQEP